MSYLLNKKDSGDGSEFLYNEWLETDGASGWASSTLCGLNSRRYHGLLVTAMNKTAERKLLLSKLDEQLCCGDKIYDLSCNQFEGASFFTGLEYLQEFKKDIFPEWTFACDELRLKKTILAVEGEAVIIIQYTLLAAPGPVKIRLMPLVAGRDYHSLSHANSSINTKPQLSDTLFSYQPYGPETSFYIKTRRLTFESRPLWYYNFLYKAEQERGQDCTEDLFSPGLLTIDIEPGESIELIIGVLPPAELSSTRLISKELKHRLALLKDRAVDDFSTILLQAAEQFTVRENHTKTTIIAGYHWFTSWGRDTMISLPGLCLVVGKFTQAREILLSFSAHMVQGIIPNRFLDVNNAPEYNTSDATLWFFIACYRYQQLSGDLKFIELSMMSVFSSIIEWHEKGTLFNIHIDTDGLLYAGQEGIQLTWMDAKVENWVVTPRTGKAVEINALWYNLLRIYAEFLSVFGRGEEAIAFTAKAEKVKEKFNELFWNESGGYCFDVIETDRSDDSFRPNQLFAISLPFSLLDRERSVLVFEKVKQQLLTPRGLRSLSPASSGYKPYYFGNRVQRDGAYHQGTVWSWLLGPYIDCLIKLYGEEGRQDAKKIMTAFEPHLREAGIGTVSEIFDATEPYYPKGCIAQAWSVAEILRVYLDYRLYLP